MRHRYFEVDVFGSEPLGGNSLAVVADADDLDDETMQRFARFTGHPETAFLLAAIDSSADYRVRIFTPSEELPFAGHPTLGSARAWREVQGGGGPTGCLRQECGIGVVEVFSDGHDAFSFVAPPVIRAGSVDPGYLASVVEVLGIDPGDVVDAAWVDNGPGWVAVLLGSADEVLAVNPRDSDHWIGVVGPHPRGSKSAFEVRAFLPFEGRAVEDPVTGSLNASVAQWLIGSQRARPPYLVTQGRAVGRSGLVSVTSDIDGKIRIGGSTILVVDGMVEI
jgi:PhzF family phenazine biosynthesis protein